MSRTVKISSASAVQSEHDAINAMLHTVDDAIFAGASGEAIALALNVVILFCRFHFRKEEALMEQRKYPARARHAAAHREFLEKLYAARRLAEGSNVPVAALDFLDLLHNFRDHVEMYDTLIYEE
jgi:hemerythrin-like metal-binding protein